MAMVQNWPNHKSISSGVQQQQQTPTTPSPHSSESASNHQLDQSQVVMVTPQLVVDSPATHCDVTSPQQHPGNGGMIENSGGGGGGGQQGRGSHVGGLTPLGEIQQKDSSRTSSSASQPPPQEKQQIDCAVG